MEPKSGFSVFRGLVRRPKGERGDASSSETLHGASLEDAYRNLLLENQMLTESNLRLHDRLARAEAGLGESPAERQLIQAQRNALVERTHMLREMQYAKKTLERERDKMKLENSRLRERLARSMAAVQPLSKKLKDQQLEIETLEQQLVEKRRELAMLTDRYYQLQSRVDPQLSADRVINADF